MAPGYSASLRFSIPHDLAASCAAVVKPGGQTSTDVDVDVDVDDHVFSAPGSIEVTMSTWTKKFLSCHCLKKQWPRLRCIKQQILKPMV